MEREKERTGERSESEVETKKQLDETDVLEDIQKEINLRLFIFHKIL